MIQALIEIIIAIVGSSEIKIAPKESIPPALDLRPVCAGMGIENFIALSSVFALHLFVD